jgi:hypothetical protein
MDVLDRVREIGTDLELTDAQLVRAAAHVRAGLREDRTRGRKRLWIGIGGVGGALAAATAATAIVVAATAPQAPVVEAVTPPPTAPQVTVTPAPAEPTTAPVEPAPAVAVLEHAAGLAPLASPQLQPGQYLLVQSRIEYIVTYDAEAVGTAPYGSSRADADAGWLATSTYDTYIPADRHDEWVRVFNPDLSVIDWYGPGAEELSVAWEREVYRADPILERIQGGLIEPYETGYTLGSPEYYAAMPRDPRALLDWYWDYNGLADEERATEILAQALIFDLEINAAPADLRASLFRALSLIEGVAVQSVEGVVTTLSIDVDPDGTRLVTLSIDMDTGLVVGSSVTRGPGGAVIPDGVPDHRVITTTEVVDAAP